MGLDSVSSAVLVLRYFLIFSVFQSSGGTLPVSGHSEIYEAVYCCQHSVISLASFNVLTC